VNESKPLRAIVAGLCAYETVAILTDNNARIPTITYLQSRRPVFGAALVAALAVHFIATDRRRKR
jgi:hypothetical protein